MGRIRWMGSGAAMAVIAIVASSFWPRQDQQAIQELRRQNARLEAEKQELQKVVTRLDVENRVAEVEILQQHRDEAGRVTQTVVGFTELDRDGNPQEQKVFGIPGDVPHFDALVIKFESDYVKQGDALRGKSLALFRRIYGETQAPVDGYWLDATDDVPDVYRVTDEPSDFERRLWRDFWSYASDREKARGAGVRVAQGEAVYAPVREGERWTLTLEGDGGLNLIKTGEAATPSSVAQRRSRTTELANANLHAPSPLHDGTAD